MSANNQDSGSNHLNATTLNVDSAKRVSIFGWIKPNATATTPINDLVHLATDGSGTTPVMQLGQTNSADRFYASAGAATVANATDFAAGTWASVAADYGPFDNTSRTLTLYINGVSRATQSTTINGAGAIMDTIRVLNRLSGGSGFLKGLGAELAIASDLSGGELTALLAKQQLYHVGAWDSAKIVHAWRLYDGPTAIIGGVDLSATGTVLYPHGAGDHPSVTDAPPSFVPYSVLL